MPATPQAAPSARARVGHVVVVLGVVSLVTDVSTESVNAVLPNYLILIVGLSPQAFGVVNGLYNGVSALVRILAGWTADRSDRPKWVAGLGYLVSAVSKLCLLCAASFGAFSAITTADQIGKGIRTAPRDSMIVESSQPRTLSRAFGVHRTLDTFGAFLGPLLAFCILDVVPGDYHSVFVMAAAFAIVGVATLVLMVPDLRPRARRASSPATPALPPPPAPGRVSVRLLATPAMARLITAAGLLGLLTVGEAYVFLELQFRDGLALKYFPLLVVGMNLSYLVLAVPIGRLADRVGRWVVFVGGYTALLAAYLVAGGPLHGAPWTYTCLALLGAFYAATDGVLAALAGQVSDASVRTSAIATAQTVMAGAAFVASLGFAQLWSAIGRADALLAVAAALACVLPPAALLLRRSEPARRRGGPVATAAP